MRRAPWLLLFLACLAAPVRAHDVKDPVCRMMTDTDTTPFRETSGGGTVYFCSAQCQAKFDTSPSSYLKLAQQIAQRGGQTDELEVSVAGRVRAGRPIPVVLAIREAHTGRLVRSFETVHEKKLHLILVSQDLTYFQHLHPIQGADGLFRLSWAFPHLGRYFLFADVTPVGGDNQILRSVFDVGTQISDTPATLRPDTADTRTVGDTRVQISARPLPMRAGVQTTVTYTLSDLSGHPRTDFQPLLGVMGHLIAVREDGELAVHTHALHSVQAGSYGAAMLRLMQAGQPEPVPVTPDMVTPTGPAFTFKLTLPTPGRYRLWAQFQRQNKWLTVPFTVAVQ